MRKFLVALLILSVMGGVFAQEEGKGTWSNGAVSGELNLSTTLNLLPMDTEISPTEEAYIGMYGSAGTTRLRMTFNFEKGDWAIRFPLQLDQNRFGSRTSDNGFDDSPRVTYKNGPITVEIPFEFQFTTSADGALPISWTRGAPIRASYVTDNYKFNARFAGLSSSGLSHVGGWWKFGNDSELAVSYLRGYDASWWRASEVVLDTHSTHWDNIGAETSPNGIAYRYFITPEMQAGIAFAGTAGNTMFSSRTTAYGRNFAYEFLQQATFGFRYTVEDGLDFSAMVGLRNWLIDTKDINEMTVPIHLGASYKVMPDLKVQGDMVAALFVGDIEDLDPFLSIGARVTYGDHGVNEGLWAVANIRAVNLTAKDQGIVFNPRIIVGYNNKPVDGNWNGNFKDSILADSIYGGLDVEFVDLVTPSGVDPVINVLAFIGYNQYVLSDNLKVGAEAGLQLGVGTFKDSAFAFYIQPKLEWMLIDSHSGITFTYNITAGNSVFGANNTVRAPLGFIDDVKLTRHDLTVAFKWTF